MVVPLGYHHCKLVIAFFRQFPRFLLLLNKFTHFPFCSNLSSGIAANFLEVLLSSRVIPISDKVNFVLSLLSTTDLFL